MTGPKETAEKYAAFESPNRLAALGTHLATRDLRVELKPDGLHVTQPQAAGCCASAPTPGDTIRCQARPEDDWTLWFFTSWNQPLAPATEVVNTAVRILGYLTQQTRPHPRTVRDDQPAP